MPVKIKIEEPSGVYFITFTCYKWLHLIELSNGYGFVYKWFDYLQRNHHHIAGFVVMPNHIHALIAFVNNNQSINNIIGNGKRFLAYQIINQLKLTNQSAIVNQLGDAVSEAQKKRNKKHELWEPSFDWKLCQTEQFMEQKLEYMHLNPCTERWYLASKPEDYIHSSAKYYLEGNHALYPITNYKSLKDINFG